MRHTRKRTLIALTLLTLLSSLGALALNPAKAYLSASMFSGKPSIPTPPQPRLAARGISIRAVVSAAALTTDKYNYSPGETVTITGTGWQPGESVSMVLHREPETLPDTLLSSVADANGSFTNTSYVVHPEDFNVTFTLTATGLASGSTAQTTFIDAIAFVQDATATAVGASTVTATFASAPTPGNMIIAVIATRDNRTINRPTGFTSAINQSGTPSQAIFYKIAGATESQSVTVTVSSNSTLGLHIYEYSGLATLNVTGSSTGTGTSVSSGTATTTVADTLLLAGLTSRTASTFSNFTNSFTEQNDFTAGGSGAEGAFAGADRIVAATGSYSTTATATTSGQWRGQIAAFRAPCNTYTTIASGNWNSPATWMGGVVPSSSISSCQVVNIGHVVTYNLSNDLEVSGIVKITNGTFRTALSGNGSGRSIFIRAGGNWIMSNSELYLPIKDCGYGCDTGNNLSGNFINENGNISIKDSRVEIAQNWESTGTQGNSTRTVMGGCLRVGENFKNTASVDTYDGTCIETGLHNTGNWTNEYQQTFQNGVTIKVLAGNFENNGSGLGILGGPGSPDITNLGVSNGNLVNNRPWSAQVQNFCVSGNVSGSQAADFNNDVTNNDTTAACNAVNGTSCTAAATANAGPDQTVCSSSPLVTLDGTIGGSAGSGMWTSSGTGAFGNANSVDTTYTPSLADITAGTVTLTLTTNDPVGCAGAAMDTMTVTINPAATVDAGPASVDSCGTAAVNLNGSFGGGATGVTWMSSGTGTFGNANAAVTTYTPSAADVTAGSVTLTLTTNDPTGPCPAASDTLTLNLFQPATVDAGPASVDSCGTAAVMLNGSFGGSAMSVMWMSSGTGTFGNAGAAVTTYTPSAADVTAGSVTLTLTTNDPTGPCPAASDTLTLNLFQPATVDAGPASMDSCGTAAVNLNGSFSAGATSVTWMSSGTGTFGNANTASTTYTPSAADVTAGTVTLTLTTNDPAGPCDAVSDTLTLNLSQPATVDAGPASTDSCGTAPVMLNGSFGGGATSVTWMTSGTGTFGNANAAMTTYTPSAADVTAGSVTLTLTTDDPAGPCPAASDTLTLNLSQPATVDAGDNQTVCSSSPTVQLAGQVGGSVSGGTWSGGGGIFNPGATTLNATYAPSAAEIMAGTVTLTLTTDDPAGACPAVSDMMTITINSAATVDAGPTSVDSCGTAAINLNGMFGGGATGVTWMSSGTGTFGNANSAMTTYTPSAADVTAGSVTLTLTTDDPAGPCGAASDTLTLNLFQPATVDAGPASTESCGTAPVNLNGSFGGGATSVTWMSSGTGTFGNVNSAVTTYTPSAADVTAGTITLTLTTNDPTGPCPAASDTITLNLFQPATVDAGPTSVDSCGTAAVNLSGSFGGGATSVTWMSSGTGTFGNASAASTTYTPSAADVIAGTVTFTLTTNDPTGPCPAASDTLTLNLFQPATVDAGPATLSSCGTAPVSLNGSFGGSATGVTWMSSGTGTFGNINATSTTYTPSAADVTAGSVTLTLTTNDPTGPCPAASDSLMLTLNALPTLFTVTGGGEFCEGGAGVPVGLGGSQTGVNYQLLLDGNPVGSHVAGTGAALSFGNQTAAGTYTVAATNATTQCMATMTGSAVVEVNALPGCSITGANTVTAGSSGNVYSGPAGTDLAWSWSITGDGTIAGATDAQSVSVTAGAVGSFTLTLTVTDTETECTRTCELEVPVTAAAVTGMVSDQKAGSVLVFPYYTSDAAGNFAKSDTLITVTNVSNGAATQANGAPNYSFLHLFFIDGANCSPADTFVCLTPNGSIQIRASEYDPLTTGYLIAVAVDAQGRPTQNNSFIGSAFVRDDTGGIIDTYGAEAFWKHSTGAVSVGAGGNSTLQFNGTDYDLAPIQLATPLQEPARAEQTLVIASLTGDLGTKLDATAQSGVGAVYRDDEALASFQPSLGSGCLLRRAVTNQNFRIVPGTLTGFLKDRYGYIKFNLTNPGVGLLLVRQGAAGAPQGRFAGIRTLHKTATTEASLTLPTFPPFCG